MDDYDCVSFPTPIRYNSKKPRVIEGNLVNQELLGKIEYLLENQPIHEDPKEQSGMRGFIQNMYAKVHFSNAEVAGIDRIYNVQVRKDGKVQ